MINHPENTDFYFSELSNFQEPRNRHYSLTEAYSLGSSAINDTTTDLNTHIWFGYVKDGWITLRREDLTEEHPILEVGKITELDFTFDQAARPVIVYVKDGISYMYSYKNTKFISEQLDSKFKNPRVYLDDPLIKNTPTSDVILGYTYDGKLCYTLQRNKYLDEIVITTNSNKSLLWRIGITSEGRFGFQWR